MNWNTVWWLIDISETITNRQVVQTTCFQDSFDAVTTPLVVYSNYWVRYSLLESIERWSYVFNSISCHKEAISDFLAHGRSTCLRQHLDAPFYNLCVTWETRKVITAGLPPCMPSSLLGDVAESQRHSKNNTDDCTTYVTYVIRRSTLKSSMLI